MAEGTSTGSKTGFQGAIESLPLVDLLQVWSMNRFSGLVSVSSAASGGKVYLVDGEVVHAEADGLDGENAVRTILGWKDGAFELFPNTTTLHRTIKKSMSHLLLDAHRHLDERQRGAPAVVRPPPPAAHQAPRPTFFEQIRAMRGVTRLVRFGVDGRPIGAEGAEAEQLAASGLYLAMTHGRAVASLFGLHELGMATLQGVHESFVLVHASGNYLCAAVSPEVPAETVAAQIRALLARPQR